MSTSVNINILSQWFFKIIFQRSSKLGNSEEKEEEEEEKCRMGQKPERNTVK